jgi:hypothetical protein
MILRSNFFKVYQNRDNVTLFCKFSLVFFILCKDTFMYDYDGILNCNGLKYGTDEIFDTFWLISFDGDQNIGGKGL